MCPALLAASLKRIGNVEQRHVDGRLDLWGNQMHRVGRDQNAIRSRTFEPGRSLAENGAQIIPRILALKPRNPVKIKAVHEDRRRDDPATALANEAVDNRIILSRALPAHPAKDTDGFHKSPHVTPYH